MKRKYCTFVVLQTDPSSYCDVPLLTVHNETCKLSKILCNFYLIEVI